jgi:hypothetical protein
MLDPPPFGSPLGVGQHLGGEMGVELAAQEVQHIGRGEVQGGVAHQVRHDRGERGPVAKYHVGGHLGLAITQ